VFALLRVRAPATCSGTFALRGGSCVVGSGSGADLVISDQTVSRRHAEFRLAPGGVEVRDLSSRNGTFYLDQRLDTMTLSLGATVRLGRALVSLEVDGASLEGGELDADRYRGIIGGSPAMRRLYGLLRRLEGATVTLLIEGESGVGKEVVARAIHEASPLADRPLVTLNCGAIPRELLGSELFGHRKGAFTGATDARKGAFESASGGTLFLDEIGELPLEAQPALLRVLEAGEIRPVGSDAVRKVAVRILAATNRDLRAEVAAGRFREDLYYRLAVVRLRVPSVRERIDDIEPLARSFAAEAGGSLPAAIVEKLKARAWPGNVRELRNAVLSYVALGALPVEEEPHAVALDAALESFVDPTRPYAEQKEAIVERFTRLYLTALLARTGGNQSEAARIAELDRGYLGRLAKQHGK